jgi:OOP family OmpA-OmpF porin
MSGTYHMATGPGHGRQALGESGMKRLSVRLTMFVVLSGLLVGCGSSSGSPEHDQPSTTNPRTRMVLGATATANEPAVGLGPELSPVWDAVQKGTVDLTAFIGSASEQPVVHKDVSVYYDEATKEVDTDPARLAEGYAENMKPVREALARAASTQPVLDLLSLLAVMARTPGPATLLVYSSGLQTTGLLDLRGWGSELDVVATVDRLPLDQLPDLTGKRVVFIGLGQVAGPQHRLTEKMRTDVRDLWLRVCRTAGGDCDPTVLPSTGGPPRSTVAVPTIPVPSLGPVTMWGDLDTGQETRILLPNGVFFRKNTAEFLPGAEQTLLGMVHYFLPDATSVPVRATVVGHTATHGSRETSITLSVQRAHRVVDTLVSAGVDPTVFTSVEGVGFDRPLVPDLDGNGLLVPEAAEQNRTVELTVTRVRSR